MRDNETLICQIVYGHVLHLNCIIKLFHEAEMRYGGNHDE